MAGHGELFDIGRLRARIEAWGAAIEDEAYGVLEEISSEAAAEVQTIIRTSITPTGIARKERGEGVAGRIETGEMHDSVDSYVVPRGNELIGMWGWEDPEEYFKYQEEGTQYIAGMDALNTTFERGKERLLDEVADMVRRSAF